MRSTTKKHLRYAVLLTLLWAYGGANEGRVLAWVPPPTAYCGDEICQSEGCSHGGNETPGDGCFEDGGNCAVDCGYCGDTWCSPEIDEDLESCAEDCGYCGDGVCVHPYESNPSNWCNDDCGTPPGVCEPAECETNAECTGEDEVCSPGGCCVTESPVINPPYCGGSCLNNDECCGGDICVADALGWLPRCALPGKASEICPYAPTCDEHSDCGYLPYDYCDFSIRTGICRKTMSSACVEPTTSSPLMTAR